MASLISELKKVRRNLKISQSKMKKVMKNVKKFNLQESLINDLDTTINIMETAGDLSPAQTERILQMVEDTKNLINNYDLDKLQHQIDMFNQKHADVLGTDVSVADYPKLKNMLLNLSNGENYYAIVQALGLGKEYLGKNGRDARELLRELVNDCEQAHKG